MIMTVAETTVVVTDVMDAVMGIVGAVTVTARSRILNHVNHAIGSVA